MNGNLKEVQPLRLNPYGVALVVYLIIASGVMWWGAIRAVFWMMLSVSGV
ncbi:MAG: hypothetical protein ACI8Q6_003143 [Granulosicoccus sp.]|jgi:hypothetical protein